jgi:transcriptional regulator with XRE-family HTH domain
MMTLGERLRYLRLQRGISLRKVAAAAKISPPFLSDIELGRRYPSAAVLRRLAAPLKTSFGALSAYDPRAVIREASDRMMTDEKFRKAVTKLLDQPSGGAE